MATAGNIIGKVAVLQGQAFARAKDGTQRALKVGDAVFENEVIVTAENSRVELEFDNGKVFLLRAKETVTLDSAVIGSELPDNRNAALLDRVGELADITRAIAEGSSLDQLLEETAAGLTGGNNNDGGHNFVQLLRIAEALDPAGYHYQFGSGSPDFELPPGGGVPDGVPIPVPAPLPPAPGGNLVPTAVAVSVLGAEDAASIPVSLSATDADGSIVSYTIVSLPANGTLYADAAHTVVVSAGDTLVGATLFFVPNTNWNGTTSFNFTATDNNGAVSSTATATLAVTPVDDASVMNVDTNSTAEDTPLTVAAAAGVLANDSDIDNTLTVTSFQVAGDLAVYAAGSPATIAGVGTLTINADGGYTFAPASNYSGAVPVATYTVSTGSTSTLTLAVTPVDDASVMNVDTNSTAEDTPLTVAAAAGVLANDSDIDNTLTVTSFQVAGDLAVYAAGSPATIAGVGTLTINADGGYTFAPASNYSGAVPVATYTVSTGSTSTLTLAVTPVDDASVMNVDTNSTAEDTPLTVAAAAGVLANDSDIDNTLTVTSFQVAGDLAVYAAGSPATIAGVGTLTINADGGYTFAPASNYSGAVPVATYTVSTGSTSTLTLAVTPVDDASVMNVDTNSTAEDTPLTVAAAAGVLANDSDIDNTLTVTSFQVAGDLAVYAAGSPATIAGVGTLTINADGGYTFAPASNYSGAVPVATYTVSTGSTSTLTLAVTPVDDASVMNVDTNSTAEDTPLTVAAAAGVLANDSDIDNTLTVTSFQVAGDLAVYAAGSPATIAGVGTLTINADGGYTFAPASNYSGAVPVATYTVSTGSTSTLTLAVTPVDDASVMNVDTNSTAEDTPLTVAAAAGVLANDSDIDNTLTVTSFQVAGDLAVYAAGSPATIAGVGTLTINADGGYTFAPASNYSGAVPVATYTVSTGSTSTLTLAVTPVDDASVMNVDTNSTAEDTPLTVAAAAGVLANDSDIDNTLTVTSFQVAGDLAVYAAGSPATIAGVGTLTINADGGYTFAPASNYSGAVPVATYTVSTGSTSTLTLAVTPVDDASVMNVDTNSTAEDTPLTVAAAAGVLANDSDIDNTLTVTSFQVAGDLAVYAAGSPATIAGVGTLTINADGGYTFAPASNYSGAVPVATYTVSTGSTSTLTLAVTPVDDASVMNVDTNSTAEDTPLTVAAAAGVLANDSDIDNTLTVTSFQVAGDLAVYAAGSPATIAGVGTLTINADGGYTFAPASNYSGAVPVATYTVSTGSTSTLTLAVTPVDDASVMNVDTNSTAEDTPLTVAAAAGVLANDSDIDNTLTVTSFQVAGDLAVYAAGSPATIAGVGTLTINADGGYTFAPASNYSGAVPVATYTVSTGSTSTLTLAVTPVDDASVMNVDTNSTAEDTPLTVAAAAGVLANDSDIDNTLTVTSFQVAGDLAVYAAGSPATIAGVGTLTINADGGYTFAPASNYSGAVPVATYTVSTGSTSTLTLAVTPVDDASVMNVDTNSTAEDTPLTVAAAAGVLANDSDIDNTLTVTSFQVAGDLAVYAAGSPATIAGVGTLTINADGGYTFAPASNYSGAVPVATYTVSTGSTSTLTLAVTPVDDASVMNVDTNSTAEDTPLTVAAAAGVLANDSDIDNTLTVTSFQVAGDLAVYAAGSPATIAGVGTLTINADGGYTFAPASNYSGAVPVATYTVSTGSTSTLTLAVTPVDDASVMNVDTNSTAEDTPLTVAAAAGVLANDSDIDNTLTVTSFQVAGDLAVYAAGSPATIAGVGTLTINADGGYTFAPASNYSGAVPVATYTVSTGSTSTLTLAVTPVDDASVMNVDTNSTAEDTPLTVAAAAGVLANDSDIDNTLTVTSFQVAGDLAVYAAGSPATIAGVGTLTINADGGYTFAPASNYSGAVPVATYTVSTGSTSTLTLAVTPVDDASVMNVDTNSTAEDTPLTVAAAAGVLANDSDIDNTLTVTSFQVAGDLAVYAAGSPATIAGVGTLTINADGGYTFAPASNYSGAVPVATYTVSTGSTSTLTLAVTAVNDAPVLDLDASGAGTGYTTTFTENGAAVAIADTDVGITDIDSANIAGATITLTNAQAGDVLAWGALPGGITASLAGNVVTLSGSATLANYQNAIRAVTFSNTSDNPSTTPRSITVVVTDGSANSNTATTTVNITAVNDAPALDLDASGAGTGYATFFNLDTGNAIPVGDIDVSVADPDNANITSATISISATNRQGTDVLVAGALPGGITASWNAATFTMTLSGSASLADYQAAIRAVSFDTGSTNTGQRTITVAVNDGSLSSNTASTTVTILGSGNRPVIDLDANDSSGGTVTSYQTTFTENGAAVSVADADVTITDSNSANMTSATITLTNAQAGDVLAWGALPGGITASLAGNVVTLTGNASIANYQAAIRAVTFSNSSDNPSTTPRTITVTVNDGGGNSNVATTTIAVTAVNDAPVLDLDASGAGTGYTTTFTENGAAVAIADTDVGITDIDSANIAGATITLTNAQAGDVLAWGALPGGITASLAGNVVTLSGSATLANYQNAIRAVTFSNTSDNPSTTPRSITVVVTDGSANSNTATTTVNITAVNDAPALDLDASGAGTGYATTFTENGAAVAIADTDVSVADVDSANITGATITLSNPKAGDVLAAGSLPAGITATVAGNIVLLSGSATLADYQTAIRAITFANTAETPDGTPRSITVTVTDGSATSNSATATINVVAVNDAPVLDLDASAAGTGYTSFFSVDTRASVPVSDTDISIADADSSNITGATITLTNAQAGDTLSWGSLPAGITASLAGNVVTLSGSAFWSDYQLAIRAVTFNNSAGSPDLTARTITVSVTDGSSNSNTATATINMIAANTPPVADAVSTSGNEDVLIPITLTGSDADGSVANFTLSTLPAYGQLYLDAAMTQLAPTGTLLAATGNALTLYYMPPVDWNGSAGFNYSAVDNLGGVSPSASASINVAPVSDGNPLAASDSFTTVLGTPLNISKASLLANDTLFDHASLVSSTPLAGLVDNGSYYTWTPSAAGTASFTYTLQDDDGQTSTATVSLTAHGALDDLATVQESALIGGAGSNIASGNLFSVGETNTSVLSINGITPVSGVITVTTAIGQLVVNSTNGNYTYTLNSEANNSAPADNASVTEIFNYVGNNSSAALRVTVQDDRPVAANADVEIPESVLPSYSIVLVVDTSGSMAEEVRSVNADGTVTVMTRMAMTKLALISLVQEYFSQSADVQIKIIDFDSAAAIENGGAWFTSEEAAVAYINSTSPDNFPAGGSTNYQAALDATCTALGSPAAPDPGRQNIVYFLSDGDPTTGTTATGITNYLNYIAGSNAKSYAIGVGAGISNTTYLNQIHNVDSVGDGVVDNAIIVADVSKLEQELLATVPAAYGGNVVSANSSQGIVFGADGGYISSISVMLDTDGNSGTPEQLVTFSYNNATNVISSSGPFPPGFPTSANLLTLNASKGFAHGILVFDFQSGDYTYYTAGIASEGDTFALSFTATDLDGDSVSAMQTITVVDGKPVANADSDTLQPLSTSLEGNVVTGIGTDGGIALGSQLTSFTPQASGVDNPVDNASVTSIVFKGVTYNLTVNSSGSASGGSYTVSGGLLTWTHASDGSQLVFGSNGYYHYAPPTADIPNPATSPTNKQVLFTSDPSLIPADGVTIQGMLRTSNVAGSGTLNYNATTGVGITEGSSTNLNNLEMLVVNFSSTTYAQGVQGLRFEIQNGGATEPLTFTFYHIDGHELGQYTVAANGWITMPAEYSNVGSVTILTDASSSVRVRTVEFDGVLNNASATPVAPEQVEYTLTDSDGDTSSATLTLSIVTNNLAGDSGANTVTGTTGNDYISGLGGNDTLSGGGGHDIIQGGDGNDAIDGGADDDVLTGGAGTDTITGGAGSDTLRGQDDNDTLDGGIGNDRLEGGIGADVLVGGDGDDVLIGGPGTDTLTGGLGADVFKWELADRGVKGNPATDTVTDFDPAAAVSGGDVLDLRDLLANESHTAGSTGNLSSFLHFEQSGSDTVVHISSTGGFSGGFVSNQEDHSILLQGVDLIGSFSTDQQIIQDLLNKGKLVTD